MKSNFKSFACKWVLKKKNPIFSKCFPNTRFSIRTVRVSVSSALWLDSTTFWKRQDSTLYIQTFFLGTSRPEPCDVPLALTFRLVRYCWRSEARLTSGDCEAEGRRAYRWSFCLRLALPRLHFVLCWRRAKFLTRNIVVATFRSSLRLNKLGRKPM